MTRFIVLLSFVVLVISCGRTRLMFEPVPLPEDAASLRLIERMDAIGKALAKQGYVRVGFDRMADVSPKRVAEIPLALKSKKRLVVVVIGNEEEPFFDVDLTIKADTGQTVTADTAPNSRSTVSFVARPDTPLTATISSKVGEGQCMLTIFEAEDQSASAQLATLFDADPVKRRKFGHATKYASTLGFRSLHQPTRTRVRHGEHLNFSVQQKKGTCYMLAATGTAGVDQIEGRLYVDGQLWTTDLQGRPETWVRNCAEKNQRVKVQLKVIAGSGTVTAGWFDAARHDVYEIVGPPLKIKIPSEDMESLSASVQDKMTQKGYTSLKTVFNAKMAPGERAAVPMPIAAGECVAVYGFAESSVKDLDMEVRAQQQVLTFDRQSRATPDIGICSPVEATFTLFLIAMEGQGRTRAIAGVLPPVSLPDIPDSSTTYLAREVAAQFLQAGLAPKPSVLLLDKGQDKQYHAKILLDAHRCYGFAAIADTEWSDVRILDSQNKPSATWKGFEPLAVMTVCPFTEEIYKVEARSSSAENDQSPPYLLVFESPVL